MNIDRIFLIFVAICAVFVSVMSVMFPYEKEAGTTKGERITLIEANTETRLEVIPNTVTIRSVAKTKDGAVLNGAKILINSSDSGMITDDKGMFMLDTVNANDLISLEKDGFVSYDVTAASLAVSGDNDITHYTAYPYSFSFTVTPSGGTFSGDNIKMEIPNGAVDENITISAALLPAHLSYDTHEDMQIERLGSVALEPSGATFNTPITISLMTPLDQASTDNDLLLYDEQTKRHKTATNSVVVNNNGILSFKVNHFSRYTVGDPSRGVQSVRIGLPSKDANGDKRINPLDATTAVLLSGGMHQATWSSSEKFSYKVNANTTRGSSSGSSQADAISASAATPLISVSASQEVSNSETQDVLRKLGFSNNQSTISLSRETLFVDKYNLACKMVFPLIEPWRIRLYHKIDVLNDLPLVERAFNSKNRDDNVFYNFKVEGSDTIVSGAPLAGGQRIAVRRIADGSLEIFRVTNEYILRKPVGSDLDDCSEHQREDIATRIEKGITTHGADTLQSFFGGEALASSVFTKDPTVYYAGQNKDGYASVQYDGWGILSSSTPIYRNDRECGSGDITDSFTIIEETETVRSTNRTTSRSYTGTNSGSVTLGSTTVSGVSFGGTISSARSANTVNSYSNQFGRTTTFLRSVNYTTTIKALNTPPHSEHLSDHVIYDLHALYTLRQWMPLQDDSVPSEVKDSASTGSIPSRFFVNSGDQQFMHVRNEGWFISGPKQHKSKKLGVALIRVNEESCIEGIEEPHAETERREEEETETEPEESTEESPETEEL